MKKIMLVSFSLCLAFGSMAHAAAPRKKGLFDQIGRQFSHAFAGLRSTTAPVVNPQSEKEFTGEAAEALYYILGGRTAQDHHVAAVDIQCESDGTTPTTKDANGKDQPGEPIWVACTIIMPDYADGDVSIPPKDMEEFIDVMKAIGINPRNVASMECYNEDYMNSTCKVIQ